MRSVAYVLCGTLIFGVGAIVGSTTGGATYAAYSDSVSLTANTAGAGLWMPSVPLPAECGPPSGYSNILYGTDGDDVMSGGNQRQIIMGLGGDDVIRGGNSGDCLVGGDGNDELYGGNGKDILIGGAGDDQLVGGNGKDVLDGDTGVDVCDGANGKNTLVDCETTP